jgi:hypothetical protein
MSGSETKEETKPSDEFTSITMPLGSPVSSRASSEAAGGDSLGRSQVGQKLKDMNIDTKIYLNHKTKVGGRHSAYVDKVDRRRFCRRRLCVEILEITQCFKI